MSAALTAPSTSTRTAIGIAATALACVAINAVIALVVSSLIDAPVQMGLVFYQYAPLTIVGVLAGTAGWAAVRRRSVLRILVPAVVLVSFVPDFLILTIGATALNVAGLLLMHVVVAIGTVTTASRLLPAR